MPFGTGERKWFIKRASQVTGKLGIASILFWMPRAAPRSLFLAAAPTSFLSLTSRLHLCLAPFSLSLMGLARQPFLSAA